MMKMTKREKNALGIRIERLYGQNFANVQIPIMDIPRIYRAAEVVAMTAPAGQPHETTDAQMVEAMRVIIDAVRKN